VIFFLIIFHQKEIKIKQTNMANDWENPRLLHLNRLPPRTDGYPFSTEETALQDSPCKIFF